MTDQDKIMRKSFEAWAEETWPTTITPDGDGYKEPEIQIDWECWQAATAAAMSMKPESIDTSTERVDVGEPVAKVRIVVAPGVDLPAAGGLRVWAGGEGGGVRPVLDPCCGSRMMWFDRRDPRTVFGDRRAETITVTDRSHGNPSGTRTIIIEPDTMLDFRALPYADSTFHLIAFDPPHLVRAGPKSWLAAKYGKLSDDWRSDLRAGFSECFRVLKPNGTLVFKWNETQVKLNEVLTLTPARPLFGNTSGRKAGTHWLVFIKPAA